MAEQPEPIKPKKDAWVTMNTETVERHPKVDFEINISKTLVFTSNDPREYSSKEDDSVYYIFDCQENAEPKVVMTSAWSLLRGLKSLSPIAGKKIQITKKLVKGKQQFEVIEIK